MGLDVSHDAFSGAYSSFNRLRQVVARAMGGSFPPHYKYNADGTPVRRGEYGIERDERFPDEGFWYSGKGYSEKTHPGLYEFLKHSDCDGEIPPEMCVKVADDLEALLPKVQDVPDGGHIGRDSGYVAVLRKFIAGCRAAAAAGEPLDFH